MITNELSAIICGLYLRSSALFFLAYFLINLSTLPSESTNFCFPEKKGWQFEQISTFMVFLVERVCTTLPQAHIMVASSYLGWPLSFIKTSSMRPTFFQDEVAGKMLGRIDPAELHVNFRRKFIRSSAGSIRPNIFPATASWKNAGLIEEV